MKAIPRMYKLTGTQFLVRDVPFLVHKEETLITADKIPR